jgi:Holliday junction resolvasome RuvABC endonuclease subunit
MLLKLLTIDPGLNNHTGYAITERDKNIPSITGVIKLVRVHLLDWMEQSYAIARQLARTVKISSPSLFNRIDLAIIEIPEMWGSSKSYAATANDNLFKLMFLCGHLHYVLKIQGIDVQLVKAKTWKGQMPKSVVSARIERAIGLEFPDHIADAVGIALWKRGLL